MPPDCHDIPPNNANVSGPRGWILSRGVGEGVSTTCNADLRAGVWVRWTEAAAVRQPQFPLSSHRSKFPADAVALHMAEFSPPIANMLEFKSSKAGFECHVDEESAMAWLKQHRPDVHASIEGEDEEDSKDLEEEETCALGEPMPRGELP